MKVFAPGTAGPPATRRVRRSPAGSSFSVPEETADGAQPARASAAGPLAPVQGVIALQEVADATDERRRALLRGHDLLDRLDEIRHALLLGRLPRARLEALAQRLADQRERVRDPDLAGLMNEIEVRVAVELAKLDRAR